MDVTPLITGDRQVIQGYGEGRFRVGGRVYEGSVLVFPQAVMSWPVADLAGLTLDSLAAVAAHAPRIEILLVGCGRRMAPLAPALRQSLRVQGIVVDTMDTGAACRTYNVLMSEERRVAAALMAVA
jgi:uncharacterized protein